MDTSVQVLVATFYWNFIWLTTRARTSRVMVFCLIA